MNQEKQGIAHHRGAVRPFGTVVADSAVQNNMLSSFHQMQTICAKSEVDVPATGADPCERKFLHLNLMFLASEKTCIRAAQRGGVDRILLDWKRRQKTASGRAQCIHRKIRLKMCRACVLCRQRCILGTCESHTSGIAA